MPTRDHLEIISPNGEVEFYPLDPSKGIANIGRHPENDVVIDGPDVALFHAVLDYRQKPYRIVVMSLEGETTLQGQQLLPNEVRELRSRDTIEINGYALILLEGDGAALYPPTLAPAAITPALPEAPELEVGLPVGITDQPDEIIVTELPEHEWVIDVEQTATCEVTIINGGDIVASFDVRVEGINQSWVAIFPPRINLNEGERGTVAITITPPRLTTSRAGPHPLAVVVTSPHYPGRSSRIRATLTINPYYEFAVGELSPRQQTISWRKGFGLTDVSIANKGNSKTSFRLEGEDAEKACSFEFLLGDGGEEVALARQADVPVPPGETIAVPARVMPLSRPLVGLRGHTYSLTITITMLEGQQTPRALMGQLTSRPLLGPLPIALITLVLAVSCVFSAIPRIFGFEADKEVVRVGEEVTLRWFVSPFVTNLQIEGMEEAVKGPVGEKAVHPEGQAATYKLKASNLLSPLFGTPEEERTIIIIPQSPSISKFSVDKKDILKGETVSLGWSASNAEQVTLNDGNTVQAIPTEEYSGQRVIAPEEDTIYTLEARNSSGVALKSMMVRVHPSSAVFKVQPSEIMAGESVTVTWAISVFDSVSVDPIGADLPPTGTVNHEPDKTTAYVLTASNEQSEIRLLQQVAVYPAPTPTTAPQPPVIEFFTVAPNEVISGAKTDIQLAWSVTGDTTGIEISSQDSISLSNLSAQDMLTVQVDEAVLLVLTARNGDVHTSVKEEIKAIEPTPTTPPAAPVIEFFNITPSEVVSGTETDVQLAWSVTGETTNVVISSSNKLVWTVADETIEDSKGVSNLKVQDFIIVEVDEPTSLVLTAFNGDLRTSQMGDVKEASGDAGGSGGAGGGGGAGGDGDSGGDGDATPTATPTATPCTGVAGVDFTLYSTSGVVNVGYPFVVVANPPSATLPLIFLWQATAQMPLTHSNNWVHDTAVFTWTTTGLQNIVVTVGNGCSNASADRVIYVEAAPTPTPTPTPPLTYTPLPTHTPYPTYTPPPSATAAAPTATFTWTPTLAPVTDTATPTP